METGRPAVLFPLFAELTALAGVGPKLATLMARIDIARPRDLLLTLPHGGIERRAVTSLQGVAPNSVVSVPVLVGQHRPPASKGRPYRVHVQDAKTEFLLVFFHARQDWVQKILPSGQRRVVSGKVEFFDGIAQIVHPDHVVSEDEADQLPVFEALYPLTAGLSQKVMAKAVTSALDLLPDLDEWIDPALCAQRGWGPWAEAVAIAHHPAGPVDIAATNPARERLAYDELLAHQMTLALARRISRKQPGRETRGDGRLCRQVLGALPFAPTGAQTRAVAEITADMAGPLRMNRLLQGDVGSGKTLVAFLALLTAVEAGGQAALMAPTEILARQHFAALEPLAASAGIRMEVLTGRDKGTERVRKLADLASGAIAVLVGTHALFQSDIAFGDLRLAVIDEQHRFGVRQRMALGAKGQSVDVLVMTATPIPRSLALSKYGDMDVSVLDEKPAGRLPVETVLVSAGRLDQVVARLRAAVAEGRQAYWVCPLVEESETIEMTAAVERAAVLRRALGETAVGLVHGQMPPAEKDAAMADFIAGTTKLLVATTVIEVGVDVPNASIMVVEGAESFGLAQLHQLRGRVGRGAAASSCLLMYDPPLSESARARLMALRDTEDGFRIAEEDLRLRGMGDVIGVAQSGVPRFRIADLERQTDLMAVAQQDARNLLERDGDLSSQRGKAMRCLLYLMEADQAVRLLHVG